MGRGAGRGRFEQSSWTPDFARSSGRKSAAGAYEAYVPAEIGDIDLKVEAGTAALSERAATAVRELNASAEGLKPLEGLARQLLRSEALASSAIEGLGLSHRNLALAEILGKDGPHKAQEVLANMKAMEEAVRIGEKADDLRVDDITAIHRALAIVPPLDKIAGQIREEQGWIGGSSPLDADYVGPPAEQVPGLLEDLCHFMNRDDIPTVAQSAIAHAQFELIHPFGDGNGRVGRCLIHVLLKRRGVAAVYVPPVSLVLGANKDAYIAGIGNFQEDKADSWIDQFSRAVEIAAEQARGFSAEVGGLQEQWREKVNARKGSAAQVVIDQLPSFPYVNSNVLIEVTGRSRPTLLDGLDRLTRAGILKKRPNRKKGDTWEATEIFALLDRFEAAVRM